MQTSMTDCQAVSAGDLFEVGPTDPTGHYFDASARMASRAGDLVGGRPHPDPAAIFSVLQFGAIVPPLSPWHGVTRLTPGYRYRGSTRIAPITVECPDYVALLDAEGQADEIGRLLDGAIGDGPDPVVLFSGGVDSGLIAARLAGLGRRDSLLLNYSFGEEDPESRLAEAMARHLGLRFERIVGKRDDTACLREPGRIYPQPFADHSTVPTWDFAHAVVERLSGEHRPVFDGTGADGAFGMISKVEIWERVMKLPPPIHRLGSRIYASALWCRNNDLEYRFRILRRAAEMPLLSAVLAQNPLAGVLYDAAPARQVHQLLADWVDGWAGNSLAHRVVAADLAMICANIFAQKARPIFETAGLDVRYPFLQPEVLSVSLGSIGHWQIDEPKAPLKRCLVRTIPREMVYRPKSGFVDPLGSVFFDPEFISHLRAAADATGPIAPMLRKPPVLKSCDLLSRRTELPAQTLNCLWAITYEDIHKK